MSVYSIRHTRSALHLILINQRFGSRLRSDSSFIVLAIFYKMLHSRVDHKTRTDFCLGGQAFDACLQFGLKL